MSETLADLVVSLRADFGDVSKQTDLFSNDLKDLGDTAKATSKTVGDDLNSQLDALFAKGMTLAEALKSMEAPLADTGATAARAAEQLSLFGEEMQIPYADAAGQLNLFSGELEPIAPAAEKATYSLEEMHKRTEELEEKLGEGEIHLSEFAKGFLEFEVIEFAVEKLKEFVTESLETYAAVEKSAIALTALLGSANQAGEAIEKLKEVALSEGLSFESLVTAEQRMTAFGISAEAIPVLMRAAADAAGATGTSFEAVSSSIERMAVSGAAGGRQLVRLGLQTKDLATAMGVSVAEVAKTFKELNIDERAEVLSTALQKFQGVGEQVAKSLSGQFQNFKTNVEFVMEEAGAAMAPVASALMGVANAVLPLLRDLASDFKDLTTAIVATVVPFYQFETVLLDFIPPSVRDLLKEIGGLILSWGNPIGLAIHALHALTEEYKLLALAFQAGADKVRAFGESLGFTANKGREFDAINKQIAAGLHNLADGADSASHAMAEQWRAGLDGQGPVIQSVKDVVDKQRSLAEAVVAARVAYEALNQHYRDGTTLANGYKVSVDDVARALTDLRSAQAAATPKGDTTAYKEQTAAIDGVLKHQLAGYAQEKAAFEEQHKEGLIDAGTYYADLIALAEKERDAKIAADEKAQAVARKNAGQDLLTATQMANKKQAAEDAANLEIQKAVAGYHEAEIKDDQKTADAIVKNMHAALATVVKDWDEHVAHVAKLNTELTADLNKADLDRIKGGLAAADAELKGSIAIAAADLAAHRITIYEKMALDKRYTDQEMANQRQALQDELANLQKSATAGHEHLAEMQAVRSKIDALMATGKQQEEIAEIKATTAAWQDLGLVSAASQTKAIEQTQASIAQMALEGASTTQLAEANKKLLEQKIQLEEQTGASASADVAALANVALEVDALKTKSEGLGAVYQGLTVDFQNAFKAVGTEMTQAILQTKSFGDAFRAAGQSIASSVLNTIIGGALKKLESEIVTHLALDKLFGATAVAENKAIAASYVPVGTAGKLAFAGIAAAAVAAFAAIKITLSSQNVQAVLSYEAVFDAATMAAYAGVPFGAAIAAGIIADATPIFAGLAVTAGIARGGAELGPEEMLMALHPREMVLPEDLSTGLKTMIRSGSPALAAAGAGAGQGIHVSFDHANFNGVTPNLVTDIANQLTYALRQVLGNKKRF